MRLMPSVVMTKFAFGVETGLQPALVLDPSFGLTVASLYGGFMGVFCGHAARILRLALWPRGTSQQPVLTA